MPPGMGCGRAKIFGSALLQPACSVCISQMLFSFIQTFHRHSLFIVPLANTHLCCDAIYYFITIYCICLMPKTYLTLNSQYLRPSGFNMTEFPNHNTILWHFRFPSNVTDKQKKTQMCQKLLTPTDEVGHSNVLLAISVDPIAVQIWEQRLDEMMNFLPVIFALGLDLRKGASINGIQWTIGNNIW